MKWILMVLMLVLMSVSATAVLETEITRLQGTCADDGNLKIAAFHSGRPIETKDITVSASHLITNEKVILEGYWQAEGANVTFLMGSSNERSQAVSFQSINHALTKNGQYLIVLSFLKTNNDYEPTQVSFTLNCSGMQCQSDSDCKTNEFCNQQVGRCNYLSCSKCEFMEFNSCIPKCNSHNPCIKDICDKDSGICSKEKEKSCCRTDTDCNDHLACTNEKCVDGKCKFSLLQCDSSRGSCVTNSCIEPVGCVYETNQSCLTGLGEKREYMIVIGEPKVISKPLLAKIGEWFADIFRNFF